MMRSYLGKIRPGRRTRVFALACAFILALLAPSLAEYRLISAASAGNAGTVDVLLRMGVDPNTPNTDPGDAIMTAADRGHAAVIRLLLDHGGDPNTHTDFGETAVAWAAGRGHADAVRLLLAHGADPNSGCLELTPLKYAHGSGFPQIETMLQQAGEKE